MLIAIHWAANFLSGLPTWKIIKDKTKNKDLSHYFLDQHRTPIWYPNSVVKHLEMFQKPSSYWYCNYCYKLWDENHIATHSICNKITCAPEHRLYRLTKAGSSRNMQWKSVAKFLRSLAQHQSSWSEAILLMTPQKTNHAEQCQWKELA